MKKIYFLVLIFCFTNAFAQIVNIPDASFKNKLIALGVDTNSDGNIQQTEAATLQSLDVHESGIFSLVGIKSFVNLEVLDCHYNPMLSLDVSDMTNLKTLNCNNFLLNAGLTGLNVEGCVDMEFIDCTFNLLTSLNVSGLGNLDTLNCNNNLITSINALGCTALENLTCYTNKFPNLSSISNLTSLKVLFCGGNNAVFTGNTLNFSTLGLVNLETLVVTPTGNLTSINASGLTNLKTLSCQDHALTTINLNDLPNLEELGLSGNNFISLNLIGKVPKLKKLICHTNQLTSLNLKSQSKLIELSLHTNPLSTLFLKNGSNEVINSLMSLPNLAYICADETQIPYFNQILSQAGINDCEVNTYCSFTPGGEFFSVSGNSVFDNSSDGCDPSDAFFGNMKFNFFDGNYNETILCDESGSYFNAVQAGTHTIVPIIENQSYFNISPASVTVTFPDDGSSLNQNFCITPNGIHADLEVVIIPTNTAIPGFDATYKIIIKNKGNIYQSGSVAITYDDTVLDYVIAEPLFSSQTSGSLVWNYTNLYPFETREIFLTLNVNSPMETPAVNANDILNYSVTITSDVIDDLPLDNTFALPQTVFNSLDPNDKTCLEGNSFSPDSVGDYVHYMIRFENTGTFAAQNIVVKDMIRTSKFVVASLIPLDGSHPFVTRITDTNKVEFIFKNIQLPFDDANNDGYVVFKIKTRPTLTLGDTFSNTASIYFDYNFPISTNNAITTIQVLGTPDFEFGNYFMLYPNPTKDVLNLTSKMEIKINSIAIYNTLGQLVIAIPNAQNVSTVDISQLTVGNYFVKINSEKGSSSSRFVKE